MARGNRKRARLHIALSTVVNPELNGVSQESSKNACVHLKKLGVNIVGKLDQSFKEL
jgi:hypothetical protein